MPKYEAVVDSSDMKVELQPHTGTRSTKVGPVRVTLPQDVVFINDVWSGYVAHGPNAQVNLLHSDLPAEIVAEVKRQVEAIRGEAVKGVALTKQLHESNVQVEVEDSLADEEL